MDELLALTAQSAGLGECEVAARLSAAATLLRDQPRLTVGEAYLQAERRHLIEGERPLERELIRQLFSLLGQGSAQQRGQATTRTARALGELADEAGKKAKESGGLYARLGVLGGLALGIAVL